MKKILFLFFTLFAYIMHGCADFHKLTIIKDDFRYEKTFFSCNDGWYCTEIRYNIHSNEAEVITDKVKVEDHLIDPLLGLTTYLSKDLSERMPTLASFLNRLDQKSKDFVTNKSFKIVDKNSLLFNDFFNEGDIVVCTLNQNDEMIEVICQKATLEERKICIKLTAIEYAAIKKALDAHI